MVEPFVRARFPMYSIKRPRSRFPLSFGVYTLLLNPFMIIFHYILHTRRYLTDVLLRQSLTHRVMSYKKSLNAVNDALTYWRMGYLAWGVFISAGNNAIELTHGVYQIWYHLPGMSRIGHTCINRDATPCLRSRPPHASHGVLGVTLGRALTRCFIRLALTWHRDAV